MKDEEIDVPNVATRAAMIEAEADIRDENGWLPVDRFIANLHKEYGR